LYIKEKKKESRILPGKREEGKKNRENQETIKENKKEKKKKKRGHSPLKKGKRKEN